MSRPTVKLLLTFSLALPIACDSPYSPATPSVASVVVTPANQTLHSLGETIQLTAVAKDADGNPVDGRDITWISGATNVVAIDGNTAAAVNNGEAIITANVDGIVGSTKIYVEQTVVAVDVAPALVTLRSLGEIFRFIATPTDARGNVIEGKVLAWTSSAPAVVAANTSGGVMAVLNGEATIVASVEGIAGTSRVVVEQAPAKLAFANQPIAMQNGVTLPRLDVQILDALGTVVPNATNAVTIGLVGVPGVSPLAGTTQVAANTGVASFTTLAIGTAAPAYALFASSPNLVSATSNPFEIMNVPIRADSVKLSSATLKIGGSMNYTTWITNGEGKNATLVGVQAYILQGNNTNAAGGTSVIGCTATAGVVAAGTCRTVASLNATVGTFVAGPATVRIEFFEGQAVRSTFTFPITIVPVVP